MLVDIEKGISKILDAHWKAIKMRHEQLKKVELHVIEDQNNPIDDENWSQSDSNDNSDGSNDTYNSSNLVDENDIDLKVIEEFNEKVLAIQRQIAEAQKLNESYKNHSDDMQNEMQKLDEDIIRIKKNIHFKQKEISVLYQSKYRQMKLSFEEQIDQQKKSQSTK